MQLTQKLTPVYLQWQLTIVLISTNLSFLPEERIERLADILMTLQRCFLLHLSDQLSRGKVSFPQFFLLGQLTAEKALSMTEIANRMHHTTAAATGLVDRLESLKYVGRSHALTDRRKVIVSITPKGLKLVDAIREDMLQNLKKVMILLTPAEQQMWLQIYEKILEFVKSEPQSCRE